VKPTILNGHERKQLLRGNTLDLDELEIHTLFVKPGQSPDTPHIHQDYDELIVIKDGNLRVTIGDTSRDLGAGSIAFALSGDEHVLKNISEQPVTYYVLKFKPAKKNPEAGKLVGKSLMKDWNDMVVKKTDKGESRLIFDMATPLFERFDMHATALNPGFESHPAHKHRAEEIILMIKGNGEETIGETFHKASAGDVILLRSNVSHAFKNTGVRQCGYYAIQWHN
jgi:(S)-ureidoglycine aminohydrolase